MLYFFRISYLTPCGNSPVERPPEASGRYSLLFSPLVLRKSSYYDAQQQLEVTVFFPDACIAISGRQKATKQQNVMHLLLYFNISPLLGPKPGEIYAGNRCLALIHISPAMTKRTGGFGGTLLRDDTFGRLNSTNAAKRPRASLCLAGPAPEHRATC